MFTPVRRIAFRLLAVAAVAMGGGSCARLTPEQQIVQDAAAALGGRPRIEAVKTFALEGEGTHWNLGQDMTPEATGQMFTVSVRRAIDASNGRARVEQTRTPNFEYFQGRAPQKRVLGVDGDVGYDISANGTATRIPQEPARDRRAEVYHHPLTIVRLALDPTAALTNARSMGHERAVAITAADGLAFTLAIDESTKLPTRVVSMTNHPALGDVAIETSFTGYQEVDGFRLPTRVTTRVDKFTTADLWVKTQAIDSNVGDLAAPAGVPKQGISGPPPPKVDVQEVATGVWLLAGQSHHSVLIEFADHLVLFEAPSEARTLAVIAKAREMRPTKPVTHVINSHHHFDHSGGIRAAVSEGLTVITHKTNGELVKHLVERSRAIAPDALAKAPKPLKLETVDEEMILKDERMAVHLYHVGGSPHGDGLLMAYLPRERLLIETDVYSPGGNFHPYAANLLDNIRKRNLRVDRIVPTHGTVVPFADLVAAVQPKATS